MISFSAKYSTDAGKWDAILQSLNESIIFHCVNIFVRLSIRQAERWMNLLQRLKNRRR